jgi:A/G-specific adenine glycosylase
MSLPAASLATFLLAWYDRHHRRLPWRAQAGERPDPYRVLLSETMLQQTTVTAVIPYFERFITRWPTLDTLAAAPIDDLLSAWAGLGYYARAHRLHRCAQAAIQRHGGRIPDDEAALLALPGIGVYTAAAIRAIAFDRPAVAIDGNVERVMTRLRAIGTPLPQAKRAIRAAAAALVPATRPGDYTQALFDLGATICLPRKPRCAACPWQDACAVHGSGLDAEAFPLKPPKKMRPLRCGVAFVLWDGCGRVALRRRPSEGLLGGMLEPPGSPWVDAVLPPPSADALRALEPVPGLQWTLQAGYVRHIFTHFDLQLQTMTARMPADAPPLPPDLTWFDEAGLAAGAVPSLMRKVIAHARRACFEDRKGML